MRALIVAAGIIASAVSSATARAEDVDWKEIGVATVGGEIVVCFYDTVSIIYAGSHTRVWVKCIRQQDVEDTIADKGVLGKKIVDNAARKIISGYVPPLVAVGGIDSQQSLTVIVGYEAAANIGAMPTHSRVLYELNCSERMIRRLSTYFHIGGTLDEARDLGFEIIRQIIVLEQNAVLECLVCRPGPPDNGRRSQHALFKHTASVRSTDHARKSRIGREFRAFTPY